MSRPPSFRVPEIDSELRALYARYEQLIQERSVLTRPPVERPVGSPAAAVPPGGSSAVGWPTVAVPAGGRPAGAIPAGAVRPVREASGVSVQAVLLTLGGLLLGVAAIVFTLVAWSRLGVGGRAAVLGGITVVALATPVVLLRRRLAATAETVAGLALLLVLLDAYLLRRLDLIGGPSTVYAGAVLGLVALGWALYGLALPGLRGIRPTALALAQPALPLLAARGGALWVAAALLAVAALDLLPAGAVRPGRRLPVAVRVVAVAGGGLAWGSAVLVLLPLAYADPVGAVAVLLLVLAGAIAVTAARTGVLGEAGEIGVAAGVLAAAAGATAPLRAALDALDGGSILAVTVVGLAVAAVTVSWQSLGLRIAAGVLLVPGTLAALAGAVVAATVPGATAVAPWTGVADPARPDLPRLLVLVAVLAAVGVALVLRAGPPVLLAAVATTALVAPVALDLPYPVTLAILAATTLACWRVPIAAAPLAGVTVAWALATEPATLLVLAGLALAAAAQAGTARGRRTRIGAAALTVAALAAESAAVPLAAGESRTVVGFALLGVAAAAALAAALTHRRAPAEAFAAELTAAATALAGIVAAATSTLAASAACTVLAGILAGTALRPDRRLLVWPAAASAQLAVWIMLAGGDVVAPEAYTGPLTVALLALGAYRRRTDRTLSSWTAYGPGLAITALPSLGAAVDGADLRPLLLGAAALATLLLGARARLQAPLTLGAATLTLLAVDQLGPALAEITADLPRWLPLAAGGALLLVLGSTYERRRTDLRKARTAYTRLG